MNTFDASTGFTCSSTTATCAGWAPYARYYVEGGRMLFTFGDGSRQVWTRQ